MSSTFDNGFSSLPEAIPQYNNLVDEGTKDSGKECADIDGKETVQGFAFGLPSSPYDDNATSPCEESSSAERRRSVGRRSRRRLISICFGITAVLILGIGLGVGLGLGLNSGR